MDPNAIGAQFTSAAAAYALAIQPYALRLFLGLLFIEVLVTAIQYMIDQADAPRYIGRTFRHLLSAGFIYLMLVNAFPWMAAIIHSFGTIGATVSGVPNLDPTTVLAVGTHMAETIYKAPIEQQRSGYGPSGGHRSNGSSIFHPDLICDHRRPRPLGCGRGVSRNWRCFDPPRVRW